MSNHGINRQIYPHLMFVINQFSDSKILSITTSLKANRKEVTMAVQRLTTLQFLCNLQIGPIRWCVKLHKDGQAC